MRRVTLNERVLPAIDADIVFSVQKTGLEIVVQRVDEVSTEWSMLSATHYAATPSGDLELRVCRTKTQLLFR